jgi:hypothetical protein
MMRWLALLAFFAVTPAFGQADVVASCGSKTIKAGTSHNVTVDLQGRSCRMGGGSGGGGGTPAPPSSTWSNGDAAANLFALSSDGLTVTGSGSTTWGSVRGNVSHTTGKYYVEFRAGSTLANGNSANQMMTGLASSSFIPTNYLGSSTYSYGNIVNYGGLYAGSAGFAGANSLTQTGIAPGDILKLAVDFSAGKVWLGFNTLWSDGDPAVPGSATTATFTPATVGALFPAVALLGAPGPIFTIQPSLASQKYAPPSGFVAWDSGVAGGCPEATAYLERTTGGDEGGNSAKISALICGLVTDGTWAKLDALYVMAQQNQADARLNLVGTSYSLTGTATFTPYQGFSAFPVSGLNTGFNASTSPSPKFTQNSASFGAWLYTASPAGQYVQIGTDTVPGGSVLFAGYNGVITYCDVNLVPPDTSVSSTANIGDFVCDRSSSTQVNVYWNGVSIGAPTGASGPFDGYNFSVGSALGHYNFPGTLSTAHIGASLSAANALTLHNRLTAYMTSVGWTPPGTSKPGPKPPSPEINPQREPPK